MKNVASPETSGPRLGRAARVLGLGVCALLILGACSGKARDFGEGGGGNVGTGGSVATGGTGGTDTSGSTSSTSSTGGTSGSTSSSATGGTGPVGCQTPDPDCECVNDVVVARDTDQDGHGSRLCEANPGDDCDDGDSAFVVNECGGCNKNLGGAVGDACQQCGVLGCLGDSSLQCTTPSPAPKQCNGTKIEVCQQAMWALQQTCAGSLPACLNAKCVACKPGTHKCSTILGTDVVIDCTNNGSWSSSWTSCSSSSWTCSAASGTCVELFHPRDLDFNVPRLILDHLGAPPPGLKTRDVLDMAVGIAFG